MSNVAPVQTPSTTTLALPQLQARLAGRIVVRRRISTKNGPMVVTIVKLPAPDEFTSPQTVELRSSRSLGEPGDDWRGVVAIGGYGRSYKQADPETGESRVVQTADNSLTVIEA